MQGRFSASTLSWNHFKILGGQVTDLVVSALHRDSLIESQGSRIDTGSKGFSNTLRTQVTLQISVLYQR